LSYMKEFLKGLVKENPTLVSLLGMCPTLAVTVSASNALGMGAAATFVLICSNLVISLLKDIIPKQVRLYSKLTIRSTARLKKRLVVSLSTQLTLSTKQMQDTMHTLTARDTLTMSRT